MNEATFLEQEIDISSLSGYHTRVITRYFFELSTEKDLWKLRESYRFAQEQKIGFLIIGGWTNLLFAMAYFDGVVVKNNLSGWQYDTKTKLLQTSSNESIWQIAESLENDHAEPLWHRFIGLPGSIGGAIYGNAGCFGLETESNFQSAIIYDMITWREKKYLKAEMEFAYRTSFLKKSTHLFIVSAIFDLSEKVEKYPSDVDNIYFREYQQPKGNTCGSFFKNPSRDHSAGSLIEGVGLKGLRIGWAHWSSLHANFLISDGPDCRWQDLIDLVELAEKKVLEQYSIRLEREVKIITPFKYVPV